MPAIGNGDEGEVPSDNNDDPSDADSLNAPTLRLGDPSDSEEEMPPLERASELGEVGEEGELENGEDEEKGGEDVVMEKEEGNEDEMEEGGEEESPVEDEVDENESPPYTEITSYFDSPKVTRRRGEVEVIDMCVDLMTHFKNTKPILLRILSIIFH